MGDPIELVNAAENAGGIRGGTLYEALSHDRTQDGEYMTIGTTIEGETRKHQSDQEGTIKKLDEIRKKLADLSKYLNILELISIILTITVVIASVTFGVLIHKMIGQIKDHEHASVDGAWSNWVPWTTCSTSCGNGSKTRSRTCSKPPPQNGGKICTGNNVETGDCIVGGCPVHGGWGLWAQWTNCSSMCGQGMARRTRVCDNPRPQLLGNYCFGESVDFGICLIKHCKVNGGWTDWSPWFSCSATCGQCQMTRLRSCLNPRPSHGGLNCNGSQTEHRTCNVARCPVNGAWSTWTGWSVCSTSCGPGLSQRQRTCTNLTPAYNGRGCNGDYTDKRLCEIKTCPGIKSAFTVHTPAAGPISGTIRFTHVVTNIGGHYNTNSGKFTCQYPGIYVFLLHIWKNAGDKDANCYIRKNGTDMIIAQSYVSSNTASMYDGVSNSVILHLVHGDSVDLGSCTAIGTLHQYWQTSFSGFLLQED